MMPDTFPRPEARKTSVVQDDRGAVPDVEARVVSREERRPRHAAAPAANGHANGHAPAANGHANGHAPVANGHANGHAPAANGHANGHAPVANGHANGHAVISGRWSGTTPGSRLQLTPVGARAGVAAELPLGVALPGPRWMGVEVAAATHAGANGHFDAATWEWIRERQETSFYLRHGKRLLDVAGALLGFLVLGPLMLLVALLVKLDSRGPAIYRSRRTGKGGRVFDFYKFRSMHVGADRQRDGLQHLNEADGPIFKIARDPRTTQLGRFLRQTSIDEMPQFWNVLKGEMSLVGPRPPLPDEVEAYEAWQRRRLDVKPGLTCLWQISGRSRLGFNEWMQLDLEYIRTQSFTTDLKILLRTIPAVLSREGAY